MKCSPPQPTRPNTIDDYFNDLIINLPYQRTTYWENTRAKELAITKKYGTVPYRMRDNWNEFNEDGSPVEEEELVYEEGKDYRPWQLERLADQLLRDDTRRELCRTCGEYGNETGLVESKAQYDQDGAPLLDQAGLQLYVDFPELECKGGHRWYKGEGKARGNDGENPILFEDHLKNRKRREIYTTLGTPDPEIVAGLFNRTHPQGRKVNSEEQRRKHGASFYR